MIKYIIPIIAIFIFCISSFIYAQDIEIDSTLTNKTELIYFESNAIFKCNIRLPVNYNHQKKYPLVIGLHGGGSSPDNFISIWDSLNITEFIYAVPQAPYPWLMDKKLGYDWGLWPAGDKDLTKRASNLIGNYIEDLAAFLKKEYNIRDVYLLGFSQGAVFTYIAGINKHDFYKGLIIFSGPGLLEPLVSPFTGESDNDWLEKDYIKSAINLRIFIAHGTKDQLAKYNLGVKSNEILTNYGYDVTFHKFDGGHKVDPESLKRVVEWINGE